MTTRKEFHPASMATDVFDEIPEYGLIACSRCRYAVWPAAAKGHLKREHQMGDEQAAAIASELEELWGAGAARHQDDVAVPEAVPAAIPQLALFKDGLRCDACPYVCRNRDHMRKHCNKVHGWAKQGRRGRPSKDAELRAAGSEPWRTGVWCQRFFPSRQCSQYFTVETTEQRQPSGAPEEEEAAGTGELLRSWAVKVTAHEKEMAVMAAEVDKRDRTGWFNRTGWPEHLKGSNLRHLAAAAALPRRDEVWLHAVPGLVDKLIERSVAGLATLGLETRRWLRSAKREEPDQRPLGRLQNRASQQRYAGYWKQFICYALRIARRGGPTWTAWVRRGYADTDTDAGTDDDTDDGSSSGGSQDEREGAQGEVDVFADASRLFKWNAETRLYGAQLLEALEAPLPERHQMRLLERLTKAFIFHSGSLDKQPFDSPLVHFLAVLGIDQHACRLRRAKEYSYMLAGLVYCVRVLGAELRLPSSERDQQGERELQEFLETRREYLADGSYSAMSVMLSLLAYGKHVALNTGNEGSTSWSADRRTFYLHGRPIVISRFQQMARGVVDDAEELLWRELMWEEGGPKERFAVALEDIVDDVTFTKLGVSFVSQKGNGLSEGLRWMLERMARSGSGRKMIRRLAAAGNEEEGGGEGGEDGGDGDGGAAGRSGQAVGTSWRVRRVRTYLRRVDRFLELLLLAAHITGGQPARGTEITGLRHRNGLLQDRNVFVMDGQVVLVTRYHKSQSQWDKPKVVPRFLPWRVGQLMALYLAYVQPLAELLRVQALRGSWSDYIWADESGPWETERLTRVMSRESELRLGNRLTTQDYRHAAVGIGREFVGESFSKGYQDEVGEAEEAEADDDGGEPGGESAIELQSGRTTAVGVSHYGVPLNIIKHLSMRSLDVFRPLSGRWHQFLGLESARPAKSRGRKRKGCESGAAEAGEAEGEGEGGAEEEAEEEAEGEAEGEGEAGAGRRKRRANGVAVVSEGELRQAMRKALGKSAADEVSFRSAAQERALRAVADGRTPLVVVLATGGGKSLLFMAPACLDDPGVTVVVAPFRALVEDTVRRLRGRDIDCLEWRDGEANAAAVVVVSADVAVGAGFLTYASNLAGRGLLRRVFVDECHLTVTASPWRPKLAQLGCLRALGCQTVLLTATLPPALEGELGEVMRVRCAAYVRGETARPCIRYMVQQCARGALLGAAVDICRRQQQRLANGGLRAVVYCTSKAQCEELARELGCAYYHAAAADRAERLERWLDRGGFIVATSALGTGLDIGGIVFVLHAGMPWGMVDYAQESGRAGRAGELVDSVVLVEEGEVERRLAAPARAQGGGAADAAAMSSFIGASGCRRREMSKYLDGGAGVSCAELEAARCDRCGEGVTEWQGWQLEAAAQWQRVEFVMGELADSCPTCWVLVGGGEECRHPAASCGEQPHASLDRFRRFIWYDSGSHSCFKCGVSQRLCSTGRDAGLPCQWPNVLVPLVRAAMGTEAGSAIVREAGFDGQVSATGEPDWPEYGRWLGRTHARRVWGELMSNAMVVLIRVILYFSNE